MDGTPRTSSLLLARMIAARTARPGHLWVAMGLFERPQLSASIRRLLPSLAAANSQNMRWKRYLFKQVLRSQRRYDVQIPQLRRLQR